MSSCFPVGRPNATDRQEGRQASSQATTKLKSSTQGQWTDSRRSHAETQPKTLPELKGLIVCRWWANRGVRVIFMTVYCIIHYSTHVNCWTKQS